MGGSLLDALTSDARDRELHIKSGLIQARKD